MKKFFSFIFCLMFVFSVSFAYAGVCPNPEKRVDSFAFVFDQSGSMYMNNGMKFTKMQRAKTGVINVVKSTPAILDYETFLTLVAPNQELLHQKSFDQDEYVDAVSKIQDEQEVFGRLSPLAKSFKDVPVLDKSCAVFLVTDGDWNQGISLDESIDMFRKANPKGVVHIISFADTENGMKTIEALQKKYSDMVVIDGDKLSDKMIAYEFSKKTLWKDPLLKNNVVATVYFDFDKSNLTKASIETLKKFEKEHVGIGEVTFEGWTDKIGSDAYNKKLSLRRANTVKRFLKMTTFEAHGNGKSVKYPENWQNRRVDIVLK